MAAALSRTLSDTKAAEFQEFATHTSRLSKLVTDGAVRAAIIEAAARKFRWTGVRCCRQEIHARFQIFRAEPTANSTFSLCPAETRYAVPSQAGPKRGLP